VCITDLVVRPRASQTYFRQGYIIHKQQPITSYGLKTDIQARVKAHPSLDDVKCMKGSPALAENPVYFI